MLLRSLRIPLGSGLQKLLLLFDLLPLHFILIFLYAYVNVCYTYMGAHKSQRRRLDTLELGNWELPDEGPENQTWSCLRREVSCLSRPCAFDLISVCKC